MAKQEQYFMFNLDSVEKVNVTEINVEGNTLLKVELPGQETPRFVAPSDLENLGIMTKSAMKTFIKGEISEFKNYMKQVQENTKNALSSMEKMLKTLGK